jgi:Protein of unknown function (DUF4239)
MPDWIYHLPITWMTVVVVAATSVVSALVYGVAVRLAANGRAPIFKGVSPVMLTPLAVLFGLIVAFLSSQVWSDSQRANATVAREASALRTVLLLAPNFSGDTEARIRTLVRRHIDDAINREWPAMARQEATLAMFSAETAEMPEITLALRSQDTVQALAQRELLAAFQVANDARRERIVISQSSINWIKWAVVFVLAILILFTIAFVHIDNRATAAVAMTLFSVGVAACIVLIAAHNRPFTGEIKVGPDLLMQVMPKQ